jgi:hypothetical protein
MSKVSVITAFNSDPFMALYFKKNYEEFWKDEVDELLVCVHGGNDEIDNFIASLFPMSRKSSIPLPELGIALDYIYPFVTGDILMTIDSDCYIYEKGLVTRYANSLIDCDATGTIGYATRPLSEADGLFRHFGIVRLNTFLSFWNKKKLNFPFTFQRMKFKKGEKFYGYEFPNDCKLDTLGYLTLRFINEGCHIKTIKKFENTNHIGGLSHISRRFLGENGISLYDIPSDKIGANPGTGLGFLKKIFYETYKDYPDQKLNDKYKRIWEKI